MYLKSRKTHSFLLLQKLRKPYISEIKRFGKLDLDNFYNSGVQTQMDNQAIHRLIRRALIIIPSS